MNQGNTWTLVILAGLTALILGLSLSVDIDINLPDGTGDPSVPSDKGDDTDDNDDTDDAIFSIDQGGRTDRTTRLHDIAENVSGHEVSSCAASDPTLCSPEELALDHMINNDTFENEDDNIMEVSTQI